MPGPLGAIWAPAAMRFARSAATKASKLIRNRLAEAARPTNATLEPVLARVTPKQQPVHPAAILRQQKSGRWYSTSSYQNINAAVRRFMSTGRLGSRVPRLDRAKFNATQTGRAISQFSGRAPFASTLRPNLTGGALPRSAGGYGLGSGRVGGARYFTHGPAAPAQVVQNVSSAVRAFWISGQKAQFNGLNAQGEKQYRAVSSQQDQAARKMASSPRSAPGAHVDFRINPTVTALSPLAAAFTSSAAAATPESTAFSEAAATLNTEGFFDVLSGDFARALNDLSATLGDIRKLASLGDLPVQLEKGHTIRVRFPGVDADTVETLCEDLGLTRGIVREDPDFNADPSVAVALKFPFAPGAQPAAEPEPATAPSVGGSSSPLSLGSSFPLEDELFENISSDIGKSPWLRSSSAKPDSLASVSLPVSSGEHCSEEHCSEDFDGVEGIYRFIDECDRARGQF